MERRTPVLPEDLRGTGSTGASRQPFSRVSLPPSTLHGARVPSSCHLGQRLQVEGQSYPWLSDNWDLADARLPC